MINTKVILLIVFITVVMTQIGIVEVNAKSGNISSKMEKMAKKFSESYTSKSVAVVPGTLAVFPFQADAKLAKRKIDFAVGEMFTRQLIETGSFKIVERVELKRVLEEQRLGLTGIIETKSAVEVGKLLGAEFMVMGSIARMGRVYQINARLIDALTGEVISTDFAEIDVKIFEEEAKPYIGLVPEKQAIGLQLVTAFIPFSFTVGPPRTFSGSYGDPETAYSATVTPRKDDENLFMGVGIRYFPAAWLALEGTWFSTAIYESAVITEWGSTSKWGSAGNGHWLELDFSIKILRLGMTYTRRLGERFRVYTGIQCVGVIIGHADDSSDSESLGSGDDCPLGLLKDDDESGLFIPMARLGIEWRPQARFGLSLFGNIGLGSKKSDRKVKIWQNTGETIGKITEMDLFTVKSPAYSLETALAFYF